MDRNLSKSMSLFKRAAEVIPGGIYGHMSPASGLPGALPYYAQRAEGCRYWDVDGNEYLDFMCAYGPIILGYHHPEVEAAVEAQRKVGSVFNHPTDKMVELAELLTGRVNFADWAVFGKNGSDMTTWAIQVAREYSGRKKVMKVKGAYHGVDAWCTPGQGGIIDEDRMHIHGVEWNNFESIEALVAQYKNEFAAFIITPYHHLGFADSMMPEEGYLQKIQALCNKEDIVLILDDIRAGFRLHSCGSHEFFNFEPDIACYCKAIANGYPLSASVGKEKLKPAAGKVFLTGSYWNDAIPMAAAIACLEAIEREKVVEKIRSLGEMLTQGLEEKAEKHGFEVVCSGPPSMPFMTFADETNLFKLQKFSLEAAKRGVFFHPHHNWFLSAAHEEIDIEQALDVADQSFKVVSEADFEA